MKVGTREGRLRASPLPPPGPPNAPPSTQGLETTRGFICDLRDATPTSQSPYKSVFFCINAFTIKENSRGYCCYTNVDLRRCSQGPDSSRSCKARNAYTLAERIAVMAMG